MVSVGVREFKNHLSEYLRRVKAGEWSHATLDDLLSVTNKSPCSRNYLEKAMGAEDPAAEFRATKTTRRPARSR